MSFGLKLHSQQSVCLERACKVEKLPFCYRNMLSVWISVDLHWCCRKYFTLNFESFRKLVVKTSYCALTQLPICIGYLWYNFCVFPLKVNGKMIIKILPENAQRACLFVSDRTLKIERDQSVSSSSLGSRVRKGIYMLAFVLTRAAKWTCCSR
jgi:hypothetical protein